MNNPKRRRNSSYRDAGNYHNNDYNNAYMYHYRVHGADSEHYGEPQNFGQTEYRLNNQVNKIT